MACPIHGRPANAEKGNTRRAGNHNQTISYRAAGAAPGKDFPISVQAVSGVSDGVIQGDRADKMFGTDDPDFVSPCEHVWEDLAAPCVVGGIALTTPFAIVKDILSVVFQVRGKDFDALREDLESVADTGREAASADPINKLNLDEAPVTKVEAFSRKLADPRFDRWLDDECQAESGLKHLLLDNSRSLASLGACTPAERQIADARARLRAQ
ncbi:MAG: hypothetical protein DMG21_16735 [Acidobacteria bacterium]|nr:MAG: hypothetical protein DMG21_16735 [Acidobacteriota bacterium]